MNTLFLLLASTPKNGPSGFSSIFFLALFMIVIYFFFIMPQTKKNKAQRKFREALKKGDKVVTIGGIHGKVLEVKEKTIVLDIAPNIKITVEKSAISMDAESVGQK